MAFIGDKRNQQQINDDFRLQAILPNGAVWNNGAGGYVLKGKIVDTTPRFVPKDDPTSLYNVDPASAESSIASGRNIRTAIKEATIPKENKPSYNSSASNQVNQASIGATGISGGTDYSNLSFDELMNMLGGNYKFLSEDEINKQAAAQVDADIASQLANYTNQENTINSKYAPMFAALQANLDKTEENALRSAHRRGLATSGIVDYERNKLDSAINNQLLGLQGQQASELENVENLKTTTRNNRGNLINTVASSIRNNDLTRGTAMISSRSGIAQNILDKLIVDANTKYTTDANAITQVGITPNQNTNQNMNQNTNQNTNTNMNRITPANSNNAAYDPYDNNQTNYLTGLKATGDAGQKNWANQQLYLRGLLNDPDPGVREWARQEIGKTI